MVTFNSPFSKQLLGAAFAVSVIASACSSNQTQQGGAEAAGGPPAFPVKLQSAETGMVTESSEYVGNLEAKQRVRLAPRIEGRVQQIFVEDGDRVTTGQKIVELQPTREQEDVRSATSQVNVERANLKATQADWRAADAERARSEAQVEEARANLARSEANVQDGKAQLESAQKNYERAVFLVKEGAQAQQTLDDRTRDRNSRQAQYDAQLRSRDSARESLNAARKSQQVAERRVEQTLASIDSQKAAVSRAEGDLGVRSQSLQFNTVTAPIDGYVSDFPNKVGDYVQIGEELTTISNNQSFDLRLNVTSELQSQLRTGLPVEIVADDGKSNAKGRITFVSPNVNNTNQTILAKATFSNDGSLRDNQYVKARIIWERESGVLVPTVAVTRIGGQSFVFVAQPGEGQDGKKSLVAKQKPVTLGTIQGQNYAVRSGIKAGDKVITSGLLSLKDGAPVTEQSLTSEKEAQK
jgi:RND family efflux transporter MFP subunit